MRRQRTRRAQGRRREASGRLGLGGEMATPEPSLEAAGTAGTGPRPASRGWRQPRVWRGRADSSS